MYLLRTNARTGAYCEERTKFPQGHLKKLLPLFITVNMTKTAYAVAVAKPLDRTLDELLDQYLTCLNGIDPSLLNVSTHRQFPELY